MPIVSLITDPAKPSLEPAAAEALRNAWGGGDLVWLAPDLAAEFVVAQVPADWEDTRAAFDQMGVDVNVVPEAGRQKRLLIADMDSTMIQQECVDELAEVVGVGARVKAITARAMNGELDFADAMGERVALLAGLPETALAEVFETRITFTPGGATLLATMKAHGARAALVSGGFTYFTGRVAETLGFDEHRANVLEVVEGALTGRVVPPILGAASKVEALEQLTAELGIDETEAVCVGDGANDLGMLTRAGFGVALHAKPAVAVQCKLRVDHGDLTSLLYLQGYSIDQFVGTG